MVPSLHGKQMGKQWKQCQTLFWGAPKITADGDCSHEIKRRLLLGKKVMTNLDSILKSRDITLPTKVHLVKAMAFPVSWLFISGGQSTGASASASILPMNILGWFSLGLTGLISLLSRGLSRVFSSTSVWKHQLFSAQPFLWFSSHICTWWQEKTWHWLYRPWLGKW